MKTLQTILLIAAMCCAATAQGGSNNVKQLNPIIEIGSNCLIGGAQNKLWVKPEKVFPKMNGKEKYNLFTLGNAEPADFATKVDKDSEPCTDFYSAETADGMEEGVATTGNWNVVPRQPQSINLTDAGYVKIVGDILRSKKIAKPLVKITQAYRIDLDGDGTEEVVLAATYQKSGSVSPSAAVGDYSFLLLRKTVKGNKVQNIILDGEFQLKKIDFGAPSYFAISAIADLNGDGKMEIVMTGGYYEGGWSAVYEINGIKKTDVLECSCGV